MSDEKRGYREFWVTQLSVDGGMYSDIRVMKPSDCDAIESEQLPKGFDDVNYREVVHVIEKAALDSAHETIETQKQIIALLKGSIQEFLQRVRSGSPQVLRSKTVFEQALKQAQDIEGEK